ncbi:Exonuclease RNase T and DNA polymerase III [Methanosalsum zhilinae DSM 4017]|uniref:Exonuclease RNase T and DNA polymerase III n=1 Tax=Methanosalsum zhilinae (strain DSM 4017 / NBRC 107636 / OCM 62 / WeN5) TaxID=679901 RepID=F7XLJ5_METZD|nr:3'-5' exonuclease [Methanosalsum zhilinae]AEH60814.1 Exonuclease RNase T and DNA polymerase III [Methanosalsum zhilinae DSM 4017]
MGNGVICLDVETTGLHSTDEILQLAIIDDLGDILFYDYFKPLTKKVWPEAQKIHGISPPMVQDKKSICFHKPKIEDILRKSDTVVGYNIINYDLKFLHSSGITIPEMTVYDVMLEFADICGEWSEYYQNNKWQKLCTCAEYYGYPHLENLHDSMEDTRATLYCYKIMSSKSSDNL